MLGRTYESGSGCGKCFVDMSPELVSDQYSVSSSCPRLSCTGNTRACTKWMHTPSRPPEMAAISEMTAGPRPQLTGEALGQGSSPGLWAPFTGELKISFSLKMRCSSAAGDSCSTSSQSRTSPCSRTSTFQPEISLMTGRHSRVWGGALSSLNSPGPTQPHPWQSLKELGLAGGLQVLYRPN